MAEYASLMLFASVFLLLLMGYPVALTLAGTSLLAAAVGIATGHFDLVFLYATPNRVFGIMTNQTLIAVPLFVLMGIILERSKIAEDLLDAMTRSFGALPGGLGTQSEIELAIEYNKRLILLSPNNEWINFSGRADIVKTVSNAVKKI